MTVANRKRGGVSMPGIGGQDERNGGSACSGIYSMLERRLCPFFVIVVKEVPPLVRSSVVMVTAVRMSMELIDVYIVQNRAYNYYNFILYFE